MRKPEKDIKEKRGAAKSGSNGERASWAEPHAHTHNKQKRETVTPQRPSLSPVKGPN